MRDKILAWFATGQVGASSKAMALAIGGYPFDGSYPYDPADFNRCLLFLQAVPESREHMDVLRIINPTWSRLVDNWDVLEATFLEEVGLNWSKGQRLPARKTYDLMHEIIQGGRK